MDREAWCTAVHGDTKNRPGGKAGGCRPGQELESVSVTVSCPHLRRERIPRGAGHIRISLQSKGLSRVFSNTTFKSINSLALGVLYGPTLNIYTWTTGKTIALIIWTFVSKVRCMILDAWGWCTGTTQRDGMGREVPGTLGNFPGCL